MTKASDLEVNIDILDDDGLSQLRCRTCGKPVIGNLNGRGCPGCGWYIEQLVIDKDGWPVIVDGTPGPWPDGLSGEHRRHLEDLQDE
jgi:hypothetical protein